MKNGILKNNTSARFFMFCLILLLSMAIPQTVRADESDISEETLTVIRDRLDLAFKEGKPRADLEDLNLIVNMYNDRFGEQYEKILNLCDAYMEDHGNFILGSHKEPYLSLTPETIPTDEANEYGNGPNRLTAICLYYTEYYSNDDGSARLSQIAEDQETLTREYECALSVVSEGMSDAEKALALYDYIIAVSNYPDALTIDEDGIATYDNESYSALSVFRDHISVCVANATAYCYLLSDSGIPCVRVDSDDMEHSWTMLKVDGTWYHADPTWDNPRYMDGLTQYSDPNDDIWDLGAAGHDYFLRSDQEMENGLGHYGWSGVIGYPEDKPVYETPKADVSGNFASAFFGAGNIWQATVHYNYINGYWYFLDRSSDKIVKTAYGADMNEAEYIAAPSENPMKYVFGSGDCLYICESDGIWRYNTKDGKAEKLALAENESDLGEPVFTELNIASGNLNGVVMYDRGAGEFSFSQFSYPEEDLANMAVVSADGSSDTESSIKTDSESKETTVTKAPDSSEVTVTKAPGNSEATVTEAPEDGPEKSSGNPLFIFVLAAIAGLFGAFLARKYGRRNN